MGIYMDCYMCCGNFDKKIVNKKNSVPISDSDVMNWQNKTKLDRQEFLTSLRKNSKYTNFDLIQTVNSDVFLIIEVTTTYDVPSTHKSFILVENGYSF